MFSTVRQLVRDIGALNAIFFLLAHTLGKISFGRARLIKYYITAQPVPAGNLTPERRGRQITVSEASQPEVLALPVDRPRHVLKERLLSGSRCLVAHKGETFLGFQWFTTHDYAEDEVRCLFRLAPADRCAWDFDIFVVPEWRTQPVFPRLWDACNRILRDADIVLSLSRISAFNPASRRAHERLGARTIGWATFFCIGPLQVAAFSAAPYLYASFSQNNAPVLQVSNMARRAIP